MKIIPMLLLAVMLLTAGCQTTAQVAAPSVTKGNLTINYPNSDKYTDARDDYNGLTSQHYLDIITEHLQSATTNRLAPEQKLSITFADIDLAGDFQPGRAQLQEVRIIKEIYRPRMVLQFQLTGADGKVIKEGERTLQDLSFMVNIGIVERNEPLFYDKELLTAWVKNEFNP